MFVRSKIIIIILMFLSGVFLISGRASGSELGDEKKFNMNASDKYPQPGNAKVDYWDNGKPKVLTESNDLGIVTGIAYFRDNGTLEQEKTFDDRGKKKSIAYFDSRGGLREGMDGWAAMVWEYDDGILRGQGYYDESGHLKRYQVYNDAGDLVCKKYVGDEEPDPTELYSNSASTSLAPQSFEFYDSSGRPQGKVTSYRGDEWFPYNYPYWQYHRYPTGFPDRII